MRKFLLLISKSTFLLLVVFMSASVCWAAVTNTWSGASSIDWFDAGNWNAGIPAAGHHVVITNVANPPLLTNDTAVLASFTISDETLTFTNWYTTLSASNVTIQSGGILTLPGAFTNNAMSNRVHIVCMNFMLETGGTIDADVMGYSYDNGQGRGQSGYDSGGGGYGGNGGDGDAEGTVMGLGGSAYGSTNAPTAPGSGGGSYSPPTYCGGAGGGSVRIEAADSVTVNGTITANGGYGGSKSGGGSGGGIFITCNTFGGGTNGIIYAKGGDGSATRGGGGGGGRIAVDYQSLSGTPSIRLEALSGTGCFNGWYKSTTKPFPDPAEMGTLYFPNTNAISMIGNMRGHLIISNFTSWSPVSLLASNCNIRFEDGFSLNITSNLLVGTNGALVIKGNSELTCGDIILDSGELVVNVSSQLVCGGDLILTNGGKLYVQSGVTNGTENYGGLVSVAGDVYIGSASWIYPCSDRTNGGSLLFRMSDLVISANGGFDANTRGWTADNGPGKGGIVGSKGSGAGYGGKGGDSSSGSASGGTYGSTNAPFSPGSGGGSYSPASSYYGGSGGGTVRIEAAGSITANGTITANGGDGSKSGGGSGGGIFITCNTFGGSTNGIICANGGVGGSDGGGGGGGRIAVWYAVPESERARILGGNMKRVVIITNASDYSDFSGTVSVTNGIGWTNLPPVGAECGTIVFLTVTPPSGTMFMCQ